MGRQGEENHLRGSPVKTVLFTLRQIWTELKNLLYRIQLELNKNVQNLALLCFLILIYCLNLKNEAEYFYKVNHAKIKI